MVTSQTQSHSVPPPHDTLCGHDSTFKGYLQIRHYHGDVSNSVSVCPDAPWYALWTWPHFQRLPTDTSLPCDVSNSVSVCHTAPWYALWTWPHFQRLPTDTSLPWWRLKLSLTLSHRPMIRSVDMTPLPKVTYRYVTTMVTSQTQSHSVTPPHDTLCGHDSTSKGYL